MELRYQTLQTIYEIVKDDPHPNTYLCSPRDIIVRQLGWDNIQQHLEELVAEELVIVKQFGNIVICITDAGIKKVKSLSAGQQRVVLGNHTLQ